MILPIVAYGDPVLRKKGVDIDQEYPELEKLIDDMFDTMYKANGIGLAAPQVGKAIRLFIVDASPFDDEEPELADFVKIFINARIIESSGEEWAFNEGCLSVPGIREDIMRQPEIVVEYLDENFEKHTEKFSGTAARIIQHEYDHIDGILFTDHLPALRKKMLQSKLDKISNGEVKVAYKMKFPRRK